jgi:hypothetical protein
MQALKLFLCFVHVLLDPLQAVFHTSVLKSHLLQVFSSILMRSVDTEVYWNLHYQIQNSTEDGLLLCVMSSLLIKRYIVFPRVAYKKISVSQFLLFGGSGECHTNVTYCKTLSFMIFRKLKIDLICIIILKGCHAFNN